MEMLGISLIFPHEYLKAALMVSLLSVWMLVGLFFYLNQYTKRDYFTIWTAAWLFYALWLTLGLDDRELGNHRLIFTLKESCVAISACFLLWGSLRFIGVHVRQTLFGLFMLFLVIWTFVSSSVLTSLQVQLPVFMLLGLGSMFAGVTFYHLRKKKPFVGAGMLSFGFLCWGIYLGTYPLSQAYKELYSAGFFMAAVLQLFIAVSMVVLVLEEVRYNAEQIRAEIAAVRSEKDALQVKVITTEEQCRSLYDQVRLAEGLQTAYDELRRTQQMVVQQERLRALGQMASGIAHDVNNGLSPVVAYSELLLATLPTLPESARHQLQTIRRAGQDIANLVARMREFYRPRTETEHLVKVDLNQILTEVVDLTRPRWRDLPQRDGISIHMNTELAKELPRLVSDPGELREALINLVFNAVDALPQGGTITLSTRTSPGTDSGDFSETRVHVEVRDNGVGMDERTRLHCLEPFFSTKAQRGGTGLGLAMVYGMIQRHNGQIEIESEPGKGTCIRLTFPLRERKMAQAKAEPASPAVSNRTLNILCIDDEPQVQELLRDCLTSFGHRVTTASSGKQGIELFHDARLRNEPYETVITDLGMADVDGNQVARSIRSESPETPVIMMTGWGAAMKANGEKAADVSAIVPKPPRIGELNTLLLQLAPPAKSA